MEGNSVTKNLPEPDPEKLPTSTEWNFPRRLLLHSLGAALILLGSIVPDPTPWVVGMIAVVPWAHSWQREGQEHTRGLLFGAALVLGASWFVGRYSTSLPTLSHWILCIAFTFGAIELCFEKALHEDADKVEQGKPETENG